MISGISASRAQLLLCPGRLPYNRRSIVAIHYENSNQGAVIYDY